MPMYKITYTFDGWGTVLVEADNEEEAQEIYDDGGGDYVDEGGETYYIDRIECITRRNKPDMSRYTKEVT